MVKTSTSVEFTISPATEADAHAIGEAQRQSWLETYPNAVLGIDEAWIKDQFLAEKNANDFRLNSIRESLRPDSNALYLVAKNKEGKVRGFLYVTKTVKEASFDAIYLIKDAQGTGAAHEMMRRALEFVGDLPMKVEVADYNERAIGFYKHYGFVEQPGSRRIHRDKIPVIIMLRSGGGEA